MTAEEIRNFQLARSSAPIYQSPSEAYIADIAFLLREIAAQLAELNARETLKQYRTGDFSL